jgi:hypothetical protein
VKRTDRAARSLAVGAAVAAFLSAAVAAYAFSRPERYEAEAAIEITPVPADDESFAGFSVLREGQDPVDTAAQLVETRPVADAVALRLRLGGGAEALERVDANAEARGRVVRVRARAPTALEAARIANAFADELIRQRSSLFQSELQRTIESLRDQSSQDARRRLAELRAYEGRGDPTLRVAAAATAPREPSSRNPTSILAVGLPLAVLLGAAVALALGRASRRPTPRHETSEAGAFTLAQLDTIVRDRGESLPPARRQELRAYVESLRPYANPDGTLPKSFDPLVEEVFGDLMRA